MRSFVQPTSGDRRSGPLNATWYATDSDPEGRKVHTGNPVEGMNWYRWFSQRRDCNADGAGSLHDDSLSSGICRLTGSQSRRCRNGPLVQPKATQGRRLATAASSEASAPEAPAAEPAPRRKAALRREGRRRAGELRWGLPEVLPAGELSLVSKVPGLGVPHQVRGQLLAARRTLHGFLRDGTGFGCRALLRRLTLLWR